MKLRTIWLPKLHRQFESEVVRAEGGATGDGRSTWRTVLSTEREVERLDWWSGKTWIEILGHNKSEIDLERAERGLPILENHDTGRHVGIARNVRIEKKQLVSDVTLSMNPAGRELEADIADGIKGSTSIGYWPKRMKLIETRDDVDVFRVTLWKPGEGSFVPLPADIDSSVDRSREGVELFPVEVEIEDGAERAVEEAAMFRGLFADPSLPRHRMEEPPDRARGAEAPPAPAPKIEVGPSARDEETRQIASIAKQYEMQDRLVDWIDKGLGLDAVRQDAMKILEERAKKVVAQPPAERLVDLSKKDAKRYSLFRAIQCAANPASRGIVDGLEGEVSREIEKIAVRDGVKTHGGFHVPYLIDDDPEARSRALEGFRQRQLAKRLMTSIGAGVGAEVIFDQPGELIDLLRETMVIAAMGARIMPGLVGPVPFPKKTTPLTAYVMGEAPATGVSESTLGTGLVTLAAKTRMARTRLTRQFLNQQAIIGEAMIRDELAYAHAYLNDNEVLNGSGADGHSLGIFNIPGVTDQGDATGTGGVATFADFTKLAAAVRKANALAPSFGWLTTPENAGVCMTIPEIAAAGANRLWQGNFDDGRVAGYPARVTNLLPTNLGSGTDGHAVLGGAFGEIILGFWGAFEIVVNPYTEDSKGIIAVTSYQEADSVVQHPEAFRFFNADLS